MVVLLVAVNARYSHSCLALYALKKAIQKAQIEESLLCQEWSINKPPQETVQAILAVDPDVIGFSCYIWNIRYILTVIQSLKQQKPNVKIILGGPEAGAKAAQLLEEHKMVDYIIQGEGEKVLPQLVQQIKSNSLSIPLPGVFYRENGSIKSGPPAEVLDLAELPFPYSQKDLCSLKQHILYYESSRGCPFACSYCSSAGEAPRLRPLELVKVDLLQILTADIRQVKFVDRTFNWPTERACEIISFLLAHYRPGICFHMEMAPDLIDEKMLAMLAKAPAHFFQIEAGIQSTCAPALAAVRRRMDWPKICGAISSLLAAGNVHVHLDLIAGLPEEDYAHFAESFRQVYALGAHHLQLGFLKVLPGSILAGEAAERGLCYAQEPPYQVIETKQMTKEELKKLAGIAKALDMFYNSERFGSVLAAAITQFGDAFVFYARLSDFLAQEPFYPSHLQDKYSSLYRFLVFLWPAQKVTWQQKLRQHWQKNTKSAKIPVSLQN